MKKNNIVFNKRADLIQLCRKCCVLSICLISFGCSERDSSKKHSPWNNFKGVITNNEDTVLNVSDVIDSTNNELIYSFHFKDWQSIFSDSMGSSFFNYKAGYLLKKDSSIFLSVANPAHKKMIIELFRFDLNVGDTVAAKYIAVDKLEKRDYKIALYAKLKEKDSSSSYLFSLKNYCNPISATVNFWVNSERGIEGIFYSFESIDSLKIRHYYSGVGNYHMNELKKMNYSFDSSKVRWW